ncbi:hypothetical protein L1887_27582 [Cichorium endivia]|nr:hypothetical protein L1887_27582 [Cichorium endivia]
MRDEIDPNSLKAFTTIAYRCLKRDREERPSITDVVEMLEIALEYQVSVDQKQESAFFFNMKYFEEQVQAGEWDEVERYLCGFTKLEDNPYTIKIFFEIRKQKYLEALDRNDRAKAVEILVKDLKVFATFNEELFKEITQLITLDNFRQNEQLSKYGDIKTARSIMLYELKMLIEAKPLSRLERS